MKDIFVSYSHADEKEVKEIISKLENRGLSIYYDSSFSAGEIWSEKALEYILDSRCAIIFISKNSVISDPVRQEIDAVDKESKLRKSYFYFAVLLDNTPIKTMYETLSNNSNNVSQKITAYKISEKFPDDKIYINNDSKVIDNIIDTLEKKGIFIKQINENNDTVKNHKPTIDLDKSALLKIEDGMYENEYLLDRGVTVGYISKRHVILDVLTVDNEKYKGAMDESVEGDEDTWKEMISDTADCSINLIINHEIVGYLDFIPVMPSTYDNLKEVPFTKDAVAYYSFGGNFDVYCSMFSIDINFATQKNYQKFFDWMIEKINDWEKNGIFVNRIAFPIYSNNQARVLEHLGFKMILENDLKGMLYESTKEQFFNSQIVKTKLKNSILKNVEYKIYSNDNFGVVDACNEIALSHNVKNGGMLHFYHVIDDANIIICSQIGNNIIGYLGLKKYDVIPAGIYLEQIAIKKGYMRQGIGSKMLEFAISLCKKNNYNYIYANCNKINHPSFSLLSKYGFVKFDMSKEIYLGIGFDEADIENNYALKYNLERNKI